MAKRVGFIDYIGDNWHSNKFIEVMRGPLAGRGYDVTCCTELEKGRSVEWAKKNGIEYLESAGRMAGRVDYVMVLAPSNPETHLELAKQAFPLGLPTYVDKTFASDSKMAKAIFRLADRYGVPVITSSALRFDTKVMELVKQVGRENIQSVQTYGGGGTFAEYGIHPTEQAVSILGPEAEKVIRLRKEPYSEVHIKFSRGRSATVYCYTHGKPCPYRAIITTGTHGTQDIEVDVGTIFDNLLSHVFDFFEAGKENIDRRESLVIRRILDAAEKPEALKGYVSVKQ